MFSEDYKRGVCLDDLDVGLDWNALIRDNFGLSFGEGITLWWSFLHGVGVHFGQANFPVDKELGVVLFGRDLGTGSSFFTVGVLLVCVFDGWSSKQIGVVFVWCRPCSDFEASVLNVSISFVSFSLLGFGGLAAGTGSGMSGTACIVADMLLLPSVSSVQMSPSIS